MKEKAWLQRESAQLKFLLLQKCVCGAWRCPGYLSATANTHAHTRDTNSRARTCAHNVGPYSQEDRSPSLRPHVEAFKHRGQMILDSCHAHSVLGLIQLLILNALNPQTLEQGRRNRQQPNSKTKLLRDINRH